MGDQVTSGVIAVVVGMLVGVVLFVPFVAISYRRRGSLGFGRLALWAAALVYFWAIWTYTLLPLPDADAIRCAGVNVDVWAFVDDLRGAARRPGPFVTDPAVLQLLLNVLLFVPLGFFLRVLGGRGILVAGVVGLATSAFIETTQLTGVWGLYPCAYRVFDVDDMLTNTLGALVGSLAALVVPARLRGAGVSPDADVPRPVTRRRRLLGMLCDALALGLTTAAGGLVVALWLEFVANDPAAADDGTLSSVVGTSVGLGVWFVVIASTGRSVGDLAVRVRYTRGALPEWLARLFRFAFGVAGYVALESLPPPWDAASLVFLLATAVLFFVFPDGRGLPGVVGNRRVVDERADPEPVARR